MKFTLNWLREFVELPTDDPNEIRRVLEGLGHEVEEMMLLEPTFSKVVIGKVLDVAPHPNADQIWLCRVDVGSEELEIICGAWNFEAGAVVPVAVPGAVLGSEMEIGRRDIRGVESNGMICSEAELEIGDDAEGIMVLNDDYPTAATEIGADLTRILDFPDVYYDVSITPNRPDCMSVVGLAREIAAYYDVPLELPDISIDSIDESPPESQISITIEDAEACPRFAGRQMRNVVVGPSPHWLRSRLAAAGVRPINNVVDASNYAMIEWGHPTHAFDLDRLGTTVSVRRAVEGEAITTLDGTERSLVATDIVVTNGHRAVAVAGVMGGADTEVHAGTTSLLIEAAYWDPPSIMFTSKRLGLRSEASSRFERGMDPDFCGLAADRVAQLLEDIAGAEAVAGPVDAYPGNRPSRHVSLNLSDVPRHLGIKLTSDAVTGLLERLDFEVAGSDPLDVTVPKRRPDVARRVDLIEEIARLHGFDSIPDRVATGTGGGLPVFERGLRQLRAAMVGAGYFEVMSFSFIGADDLDALQLPPDDERRSGIRVANPLRDEEGVMRTTLLPGLLKAAAVNVARKTSDVSLFETGKVFLNGGGKIPDQPEHMGFIAVGRRYGDWESEPREVNIRDATGLWSLVAHELRLPMPGVRKARLPTFHPGRAAEVLIAGDVVGAVGELHPRVAAAFGLSGRVIAGEIDLEGILVSREPWTYEPPSVYPPAIFDLAFEVDEPVEAGAVLDAIDESGGALVEARKIFDLFRGNPLPAGRKSIAVRLTLRAPDRTLTDEEVAPIRRVIVARVEEATGASLRGEA